MDVTSAVRGHYILKIKSGDNRFAGARDAMTAESTGGSGTPVDNSGRMQSILTLTLTGIF